MEDYIEKGKKKTIIYVMCTNKISLDILLDICDVYLCDVYK